MRRRIYLVRLRGPKAVLMNLGLLSPCFWGQMLETWLGPLLHSFTSPCNKTSMYQIYRYTDIHFSMYIHIHVSMNLYMWFYQSIDNVMNAYNSYDII